MPDNKQFKSLLLETPIFKIHHVIEITVDDSNTTNPISINTYFQWLNKINNTISMVSKKQVERVMALYHN